jgi:hypothetical protein
MSLKTRSLIHIQFLMISLNVNHSNPCESPNLIMNTGFLCDLLAILLVIHQICVIL